ncbi:MAG: sugar ABC transporter permease [Candidatus Muiribacterium halophilum]|uniref:Sugar ABC transporter permease n=1 Tax=Muiribacterium halophilum TaxID=2053465 RepID=A0A2N5ZJ24_MUIH1|nr:MAG: sugar ABC transporter permease [Candidatus Muirbacterium halophilum]
MNKKTKAFLTALCYIIPGALIVLTFHFIPIFYSLYYSFFKGGLGAKTFVGLSNYIELLKDAEFWASIRHTLFYVVGTVPTTIILSLFIAMLLNSKIKGLSVYRTIYFLPVITSINAVSLVWKWLFHNQHGLLNSVLNGMGFESINWLGDPNWAMISIIIMSIWKGLGYNIIIFLAGLQGIPKHLYESAEIDGAGVWHKFRNITVPMISPVTFFVLVMSTISSFQVFAQVYMMTQGGPAKATTVIVYHLYDKAFQKFQLGASSAIALVLFLMIFTMTLIQRKVAEKKVHYSN